MIVEHGVIKYGEGWYENGASSLAIVVVDDDGDF